MNILIRNNVKVSGRGSTPIMFAHGFGCDQSMWRFVAPAFEDDYLVVTFDYVGSGGSDIGAFNTERYGDLQGYADDVIEICDALGMSDVVFVGHSVSSMIGALASVARPNLFRRLIMLGPSACYIDDPPDYRGGFSRSDIAGLLDLMEKNDIGWAGFLAPVVMKNPERPELESELKESFCSTDPAAARQFAATTFYSDNRGDLKNITVPSLIVQISDDDIAPVSVGEFIAQNLPNSSFHLMEASGHCPHMSHPEETIRIIKSYLENKATALSPV